MAVFKGEPPQLRGDEESWCHSVWEDLRPFLENGELPDGDRPEDVPKPSTSEASAIMVVDSQESIQEGGSRRQVAQLANGTQRELTEEEDKELLENEILEEMAADVLRMEDQQHWETFQAAELRTWETWAAGEPEYLSGKKKRARVQIVVQGEGGRLIRQENWLFGLQEGERLAYSVNVVQNEAEEEDADGVGDPAAASSQDVPPPPALEAQLATGTAEQAGGEAAERQARATLPVTAEEAPDMWPDYNMSLPKNFSVDDFVQAPIGKRFFALWKEGKVTDRLVGHRFGYGVLGSFYGQRDWEEGVFDDAVQDDLHASAASASGENEEGEDMCGTEGMEAGTVGAVEGAAETEESSQGATSLEPAAAVASTAATSSSPSRTASTVEGGVLSGSRQTSLSHWLL